MNQFTIEPNRWYAAIAIGGSEETSSASNELYSPLRVNRITPLKSGNRIFMLECFQTIASDSSNCQVYTLQTVDRGQKGLIAKHIEGSERLLYITNLDESWMQKHFPNVVPTDCSASDFLERAFKSNSDELIEALSHPLRSNPKNVEEIEHWGSQRYWKDAYELLHKLDEKRLISLDLHAIGQRVCHGEWIAYRLMDAMCSVKQHEGWEGYKGAPRLLLLTLALLENYSQNRVSTPTDS